MTERGFEPQHLKLSPDQLKWLPKFADATTMMGPIAFGSMCLNMMRMSLWSNAFAAWTYSISPEREELSSYDSRYFYPHSEAYCDEYLPESFPNAMLLLGPLLE